MPIKKEARNRAFWLDWKGKGLSAKELGLKYGLRLSGVISLKKVLKLRGYEERIKERRAENE